MTEKKEEAKLDLSKGIAASTLSDGQMILGRVGDQDVVLARTGNELFAIRAQCSHYRGPLVEGLIVGDTVRCPWHHACFSLRTGEALRAPALDPIACWRVDREGDRIFVREKLPGVRPAPPVASGGERPSSIVIVGGGAAADVVREWERVHGLGDEAAHQLALQAMTFTARLACRLLPGSRLVTEVEEAAADRDVGDVGRPHLVRPLDRQPAQQIRVDLVVRRRHRRADCRKSPGNGRFHATIRPGGGTCDG